MYNSHAKIQLKEKVGSQLTAWCTQRDSVWCTVATICRSAAAPSLCKMKWDYILLHVKESDINSIQFVHIFGLLCRLCLELQSSKDEVEKERMKGRSKHRKNCDGEILTEGKNHINQVIQRASHRTQRFIRWLRHHLYQEVPWSESIRLLKIFWLKNSS